MKRMAIILLGLLIFGGETITYSGDCGDVDNSGEVDILDVVYIINFKYKEGPAPICEAVTDIDGNAYRIITIGDQVWMKENLKVTHYRNGDPIPNITDDGIWAGFTSGAYCEYDNDVGNAATYGRLYNWYAIDDSRNIAPEGWHVATDEDWKQLEMYLGMSQSDADATGWGRGTDEGGKLKETGTTHWLSPNTGATNESGFTALPGGDRSHDGTFGFFSSSAVFWSSTESTGSDAWYRFLNYIKAEIYRFDYDKKYGFSVRCVKD